MAGKDPPSLTLWDFLLLMLLYHIPFFFVKLIQINNQPINLLLRIFIAVQGAVNERCELLVLLWRYLWERQSRKVAFQYLEIIESLDIQEVEQR